MSFGRGGHFNCKIRFILWKICCLFWWVQSIGSFRDYLLIYALLGIGLFFTLYLGAPQIAKLGAGFKSVIRRLCLPKAIFFYKSLWLCFMLWLFLYFYSSLYRFTFSAMVDF